MGAIAQKLGAVSAKVRWVAWLIAGFWLGQFLVTQDPIELASAVVTLAVAHLGKPLLKVITGAGSEDAEVTGDTATGEEDGEAPTRE